MASRDEITAKLFEESNPNNIFADDLDDDLWLRLNTYADGEASPEEALQIENLLAADPRLSREFSFLKLTAESVSEYAEIDPPVSLLGSIFDATTRKKTWLQRVQAWWIDQRRVVLPNALRIGTATGVLATSGILAIVVWPRPVVRVVHPEMVQNSANLRERRVVKAASGDNRKTLKPTSPRRGDFAAQPAETPREVVEAAGSPAIEPGLDLASLLPKKPSNSSVPVSTARADKHTDRAARVKSDETITVATNGAPTKTPEEMRHMSVDSHDSSSGTDMTPSLGPDVEAHVEAAMDTMPAADSSDDTAQVTAVSYKPGSISQRVNSAPPTLAMRANEAIKREHELQQYGGYTKDAYNNIQRGEVGVSKVFGKF